MKFLTYIISGIILAVAVAGMIYHAFYLALEIAFDTNSAINNGVIAVGCLVVGFIFALICDKCED